MHMIINFRHTLRSFVRVLVQVSESVAISGLPTVQWLFEEAGNLSLEWNLDDKEDDSSKYFSSLPK